MPREQRVEWSAEMARALPDDGMRYEVLDGELFVTPSPAWDHQSAVALLLIRLREYVRAHQLGWAMISPADIEFSPRRLVQPDVFVVPWQVTRPQSWRNVTSLLLATEVMSLGSARADRHRKRLIYQDEGVGEYWIVDVDARLVERWRPGDERPEILVERLAWHPRADVAPLVIDLAQLFAEKCWNEARRKAQARQSPPMLMYVPGKRARTSVSTSCMKCMVGLSALRIVSKTPQWLARRVSRR